MTLHAPDDWQDHEKLLDYGFSLVRALDGASLCTLPTIPVVGGEQPHVAAAFANPAVINVTQASPEITVELFAQPFLYAPVKRGDCVGTARFYADGKLLLEAALVAPQDAAAKPKQEKEPESPSFWTRVRQFFGRE